MILLDEPTRGLDYDAKHHLACDPRANSRRGGHAVVVSTHDVEFVAIATHRVVVMADGDIVADGPTTDVVVASPAFAPQVAKILAPLPWLTVEQLDGRTRSPRACGRTDERDRASVRRTTIALDDRDRSSA